MQRFTLFVSAVCAGLLLASAGCTQADDAAANKAPAPAAPAAASKPAASAAASTPAAAPVGKPAILAAGTLKIADGAKADGKMVFISLRSLEGRGPPIAAMRLPPGPFPMPFALTEANVVAMGGKKRPVPGEFMLKAALDTDGNPMVKSPTDLVFEQKTLKGTQGLELTLAPAGG